MAEKSENGEKQEKKEEPKAENTHMGMRLLISLYALGIVTIGVYPIYHDFPAFLEELERTTSGALSWLKKHYNTRARPGQLPPAKTESGSSHEQTKDLMNRGY